MPGSSSCFVSAAIIIRRLPLGGTAPALIGCDHHIQKHDLKRPCCGLGPSDDFGTNDFGTVVKRNTLSSGLFALVIFAGLAATDSPTP